MGPDSDTQQFERLRALFDRIAALDPVLREAVIHSACGDDADMERELRALLDAHDREHGRTGATRVQLLDQGRQALESVAEPGERVGAFVLREVLGRGGMGVVYRAERADGEVRQEVALKVLQRMHLDEAGVRRFAQERDIVAQLAHPGIARLYDAGSTRDGFPYYAMELVDGRPITAWCETRKLSIPERLEIFLKVCDAVRFAHANLVLHRDIKPANVLVDANGAPKLIDFGIAKPMMATDDTATGLQMFSPSNAAPEQVRGERCGVACDVYQLGTLLYEMLSGSTVLGNAARSPADIEAAILHRVPARPSEVVAAGGDAVTAKLLRGDLDTIALRALRKEPGQRYASVEQLVDDVGRFMRNEPIVARGGDRRYRLAKFVSRNRKAMVAAGTVGLLIIGFVSTLFVQAQRLQRERDLARAESRRVQQVSRFLVDVFRAADPGKALDRETSIGRVLDEGRQRLDRDLREHADLRVPLLGVLSQVYYNIGEHDVALELLREADAQLATRGAIDDRGLVDYLLQRALVLAHAGQREESGRAAREALAIHERLGDRPGRQWEARLLALSAALYRLDTSLWKGPLLESLHAIESDPGVDPIALARTRAMIGHNLTFVPAHSDAEVLIRQALSTFERDLPANHEYTLDSRASLGNLLLNTGRSAEAVALLENVRSARVALYGERSVLVAYTTGRLAEAQAQAGRLEEALANMLSALSVQEELRPSLHADRLVTHGNLGVLYLRMGRLEEAERHYAEAIRISDALAGRNAANSLDLRTGLAEVHAAQGRLADAERVLSECAHLAAMTTPKHVRWALAYAEVLHRAERDHEARAMLDRAVPYLRAHGETMAGPTARERALRQALASR